MRPHSEERALAQLTPYERTLLDAGQLLPHHVGVRVHLVTREHKLIQDISEYYLSGQTNFQDEAVARTASASFADPWSEINDGDGFLRPHMLQAWTLVTVRTLPFTVVVPAFCGPLTGKSDAGATVSVTCEDKGMLAMTDVPPKDWDPGARAIDVIREILEHVGETRIALPRGIRDRIDDVVTVGIEEEIRPLVVIEGLAEAIGLQFYYDAEGWARVREVDEVPTHVYRSGVDEADVVGDEPAVNESWADRPNRVLLRGGRGLTAVAVLRPPHADSPGALGRNKVPWRVTDLIENDKVLAKSRGKTLVERTLRRESRGFAEVAFSALPPRGVEPGDVQRLETPRGSHNFVLDEASIPWGSGEASIGTQQIVSRRPGKVRVRVTIPRRKNRKRHRKGKRK